MKLRKISSLAAVCLGIAVFGQSASATSVSFTLNDNRGSDSIIIAGSAANGINLGEVIFTLQVTSPVGLADQVAFYSHLVAVGGQTVSGLLNNLTISAVSPNVVSGLATGVNSINNVQGGNIGSDFDLGLAIGSTGAAPGDFFSYIQFMIKDTDGELSVNNFLGVEMAVRGQTVNGGSGSAKVFGTTPTTPIPDNNVPEGGTTVLLLGVALCGLGLVRARLIKA